MIGSKAAALATFSLLIAVPLSASAQSAPTTTDGTAVPPPPVATTPPPKQDAEKEDVRGALQALVGTAFFNISSINDRLQSAGYAKLGSQALMLGGSARAAVLDGKLLLGGTGVYFLSNVANGPADLSAQYQGGWGGFDIGWQAVDTRHFGLAALLTLGGFGFDLNLRQAQNVSFDQMLKTPNRDTKLHEQGGLIGLSVPFEVRIPLHDRDGKARGIVIGLKPGFLYGFKLTDWSTANATASAGPGFGLTGGFVALSLGAGDW